MFSDVAAAREALDEYFNEPGVELLLRLMHTAIVLELVQASETPGLPLREHRLRQLDHLRNVGQHARLEEGRLDQAPLAQLRNLPRW